MTRSSQVTNSGRKQLVTHLLFHMRILYNINAYIVLVIAHRYIKHVKICMETVMVLLHLPGFDVYEWCQ
jgi:hypothetical protein